MGGVESRHVDGGVCKKKVLLWPQNGLAQNGVIFVGLDLDSVGYIRLAQ